MKALFQEILEKYTLSAKEEKTIKKQIADFVKKLSSGLKKKRIKATVMLGGSAAKGTFLNKDIDCDIFVRFDYSYKDKDISALLKQVLAPFKVETIHGSRDYFQKKVGELVFEIVPVLFIKKPSLAVNVTDASPLHVTYVLAHFKKKPQLKKEIQLSKLFCKGIGCYGAESYIGGFSGHVLDILTIYYGGFLGLLKASLKWKEKEVIDINHHYTNSSTALYALNQSKKEGPLILIDPMQPERNAAAALSREKFYLLKMKAEMFLKKPSASFFVKQDITFKQLQNKDGQLILISVTPLPAKVDIMGAKIVKVKDFVIRQLSLHSFPVHESGFLWDKKNDAIIWLLLDKKELPKKMVLPGPPLHSEEDVKRFKEKHPAAYEKNGRLRAEVPRPYPAALPLVKKLLEEEGATTNVKKAEVVKKF